MDSSASRCSDIIVVGGGTAGLSVATRLAKSDPSMSIVVLESGPETRYNPQIVNPAVFLSNLVPGSKTTAFYTSKARESLANRELVIQAGNCLGGGSSINFMAYSRPQMIDFDDWRIEGWTGKDMIPFFKTFENFQDDTAGIDKSVHGYDGEFVVSSGTNAQAKFQDDFFTACEGLGIPRTVDVQDMKTSNAVGKWNAWIDKKTGLRQDAAHCLLYPLLDTKSTKLEVLSETKVVRVLFNEEKRATGVEYVPATSDPGTTPLLFTARKLVVLASGALGTPQILERSGIGEQSRLLKLGIDVISDLPGVGTNYQDHHVLFFPYRSSATESETLDGILSGRLTLDAALQQKASQQSNYILGWNGVDCVGKIRPGPEDDSLLGSQLRDLWNRDYKPRPERPLMLITSIAAFVGDPSLVPAGQYFSLVPYTPYPYSRGSVHITGRSLSDVPDLDCGFFSHPADVQKLIWAYKKQREMARRMAHYRGALEIGHPVFPKNSEAALAFVDEQDRKSGTYLPIKYSKEDDEAIELFVRQNVTTSWHSMGTCAMKPREEGGVIDEKLHVFGVEGLMVADMSICPSNVAANTCATALAIGHKAAAIIAIELGLAYTI